MLAVQSPFAKIFPFPFDPNHLHIPHRSVPMEGRIAIVTDAGRNTVDAGCALDEGAGLRTAKSCGPDASTLASSRRSLSAGDGDKQARSPGRARRKPLKPSCREGRVFRWTCGDTLACFLLFARGAAGAAGTRLSPLPSWGSAAPSVFLGEGFVHNSGASRRESEAVCLMNESTPHSRSSSSAKADDPVFRGVDDGIEKPRRTGYPLSRV
jgi:hypothetical protein